LTNLSKKYQCAVRIIDLVSKSWRLSAQNAPQSPAIIAFWHGIMMPVWKYFSYASPTGIVSQSKDGEILSGLLEKWNYSLIRGSSSKGGSQVLEEICNITNPGFILITPDGPRGPSHCFKAGAVVAASRMKIPLYLCTVNIKCSKHFPKSWDNFAYPLPFSKSELKFIGPIIVPKEATREEISEIIKECERELK
jgi:lysophospholipid acyltransferase (LPLAT)-like uncharacterized protein